MTPLTEYYRKGDWIETYTGVQFYVLDPRAEDFRIEDIARSLSHQCRYNGHVSRFYSVAEHSVLLSRYAEETRRSLADAFLMLMHDAVEAYMSDVPRPVKVSLPAWEQAEARVEEALFKAFGLPFPKPAWADWLDKCIVLDEKAAVKPGAYDRVWPGFEDAKPLGLTISGWEPKLAEAAFLARYSNLTQELADDV